MPTPTRNYTQWFVNCALVNIKGSGGGKPEGFAKFPGHYKPDDLGTARNFFSEIKRLLC
jgi:hypothetical protein